MSGFSGDVSVGTGVFSAVPFGFGVEAWLIRAFFLEGGMAGFGLTAMVEQRGVEVIALREITRLRVRASIGASHVTSSTGSRWY